MLWVEHLHEFYLLNSILKSIPLVVKNILLWAEDREHKKNGIHEMLMAESTEC
jgi:hypothetical protein